MTPRERVLATLNRQPADCIPFEIGGTDCSSVHVIAYKKLRARMGFADGPVRCGCLIQLVAQNDEEMIYPYVSELVGRIKAAGKKVIMHSCGAVSAFVPYMIRMGVDALNPVQVSAGGMNPADLVREYGRDIAFWGGGCDTQHALNASDPEVVRRDVRRRLDEYGPEAHLVFTQVHNIQYDASPENILAMRDEFWKRTRG